MILRLLLSTGLAIGRRRTVLTRGTVTARVALSANTGNVTFLEVLDVLANADDLADELVSNDLRVELGHVTPAGRHGVEIGPADSAVLDLDYTVSDLGRT